MQPKFTKICSNVADEAAEATLKTLTRGFQKKAQQIDDYRAPFLSRMRKNWKRPFALFELFLKVVEEVSLELHNEKVESNEIDDPLFEVLFRLQARAVQIGHEILALMKSGFADGAHARWRSLHEVAVVSLFISKHGGTVAERYLDHEVVEYCKGAEQFREHARKLKQATIPMRTMRRIRNDRDNVIAKYGASFRHEYGWAADALQIKKPNFTDLEKDVKQDKWRPYYKKASWNIHANPHGITHRMGLLDEHQHLIMFGAGEYGFADPAQGAAISLVYTTANILHLTPNMDRTAKSKVFIKFKDLLIDEFFEVQAAYDQSFQSNQGIGEDEND